MKEQTCEMFKVQNFRAFAVSTSLGTSLGTCGLRSIVWSLAMPRSIHDYFSIKEGTLSSQLPSQAIALANKGVAGVLQENSNSENASVVNTTGKTTYSILDN